MAKKIVEKIELKAKKIAKNFIVVIEGKKYTKSNITEKDLKSIQNKILIYNKLNNPDKLKEILEFFVSETTKAKEKDKTISKGLEKGLKKAKKEDLVENKKKVAAKKVTNKKVLEKVKTSIKRNKKDDYSHLLVVNKSGEMSMKGCEDIAMPDFLVKRIEDFIEKGESLKALLNFWSLCLLNPNEIARTKLFSYLEHNGLIITPSGYFVTYRMVKKTNKTNVYTDARTGTMEYVPGTVARIKREDCDEDGSNSCSKGLHTGTPKFIGIVAKKKVQGDTKGIVGDGYEITTKTLNSQSYGTGYDSPKEQKFDNQFGNQAIICLINPQHVVSIPHEDERKMRSCEFYFAKLTTAEEVIDMVEKDYLIFDGDYQSFELKDLQEMLKDKKLVSYINEKTVTGAKIHKLEKEIREKKDSLRMATDKIAENLDVAALKAIINQRLVVLS